MCCRIVYDVNEVIKHDLVRKFKLGSTEQLNLLSRFNVAPGSMLPVIFHNSAIVTVEQMKWGYLPVWATQNDKPFANARIETAPFKMSFKNSFQNKRCIIPVTGYYEWKLENNKKQPYYIHRKDNTVLPLAGLYYEKTFSILTIQALHGLKDIHERMPVILPQALWEEWLAPTPLSKEFVADLGLTLINSIDELTWFKVATTVNRTENDNPELINPLT